MVTLVFRGEAVTPGGLAQMASLLDEIVSDAGASGLLARVDPIISPAHVLAGAPEIDDVGSVTQAQIDAALRDYPVIQAALAGLTGTDADGSPVAVANIRLTDTGDGRTAGRRAQHPQARGGR